MKKITKTATLICISIVLLLSCKIKLKNEANKPKETVAEQPTPTIEELEKVKPFQLTEVLHLDSIYRDPSYPDKYIYKITVQNIESTLYSWTKVKPALQKELCEKVQTDNIFKAVRENKKFIEFDIRDKKNHPEFNLFCDR
jgi:PBP1b-binding outer membrane lipoprotein LpoB